MKHLITAFILGAALMSLATIAPAFAKTPSEVMTPYKAYRAAIKAEDFKLAEKQALKAWEAAETALGDHETTGDLAQNYGDTASRNYNGKGQSKKIIQAYERSIDLAPLKKDAVVMRLEREVSLAQFGAKSGRLKKFEKRLLEAADFAAANGAENSTLRGEIYTLLSQISTQTRNHDRTTEYAEKAQEIFSVSNDGYVTYHPVLAKLYAGYGKEGREDFVPAIMEYQSVMENVEEALPRDHPLMMRALGRWMTMRNRIVREGLIEEAEAAGLCECWPYDKKRNETVQAIKRVPPIMPSRARRSGFSIVEFDLTDDGGTTNIRILESWPEDVFEKASKKSVAKWRYNPKTDAETDQDRKDIITTVRYVLSDIYGNVIE